MTNLGSTTLLERPRSGYNVTVYLVPIEHEIGVVGVEQVG